ncbi:zinc transporter ZIP1-like [Denticeps clupeoides]|uniref:Zinc transporter ZIP1 n=1 Tax=Denticeps clupeoides TaxID=299321 RepID=A0AAY4E2G7_9TELE|nr:zinc transporter ZIP1 [Denticeps clupeoides]XP_028837096.1 zinc transporter ZIP1 [Denticeps clupeoides]XP_028837097.1 zinc transporter ZIP1 [Denticeps clupeoides]
MALSSAPPQHPGLGWGSRMAGATVPDPGLALKSVALFVLLSATLLFGSAPLCIIRGTRWGKTDPEFHHKVFCYVSCFAGGVFLATCFLDLIPNYLVGISAAFQSLGIQLQFPLPEFIMAMGFFMVLVMEQIVLALKDESTKSSGERQALLVDSSVMSHEKVTLRHTPRGSSANHTWAECGGIGPVLKGLHLHVDLNSHSAIRAFLLVFSLSLHSVFEGLAVGLQQDTQNITDICLALLLHKSVIAFSLTLKLAQSQLRRVPLVMSLLLFSVMSPLGIAVGVILTELNLSPQHQLACATLEGLASGIFVYITFMEILPHELGSPKNRIPKVALLLTGFAVVTGVLFIKF